MWLWGDVSSKCQLVDVLSQNCLQSVTYSRPLDMSLLLEQTSNRGKWTVPSLQTGKLELPLRLRINLWQIHSCRLTAKTQRTSSRWPRRRWLGSRQRSGRRIRSPRLIGSKIWGFHACFLLQAKKLKISENRKHLANVRVVQKNLVFVVGLSPR